MSNEIVSFNFSSNKVRTILIDNNPYFCVKDLRDILEISQSSKLIQSLSKGFAKSEVLTNGGKIKVYFCSEKDLYKIILRSNSKLAEPFQDWVCGEVLPPLRKTGSYKVSKIKQPDTALNKLQSLLKDAECILTFQDLINVSHKQNVREVCQLLTVKVFSQKGNISNWLSEAENMQEIIKIC